MFSKRSPIQWFQIFLSFAVCFLLVFTLVPLSTPSTASASPSEHVQTDEDIAALLAAGDYAEGEAIVIVDETVSGSSARTRSVDLLAQSESLMTVTEEVYEATLEGTSVPVEAESDNDRLRMFSAANEETISIRFLTSADMSTEELLYALRADPRVLIAEPNYVYQLGIQEEESIRGQSDFDASKITDLTDYQWGNSNTDKALTTYDKLDDFDINTPLWDDFRTDSTKTNASGTVAILDTGIDYNHPDLKNIMRNDMTSYVSYGGAYGYNSYEGYDPTDPMDDHSHGTHCAGVVAGEWNSYGVSGVAAGVKMVAVKAADRNGVFATKAIIEGYAYLADAINSGLDLKAVNNSWGGPDTSYATSLVVTQLGELGAISVFASGNEATNIDYAAATASVLNSNPYAVVVNSSTMGGALSSFSNYGQVTTDIVAPGSNILSTMPLSMSSYLPEATDDNLVFESFSSGFPYKFSTSSTADMQSSIGKRVSDSDPDPAYYFDTDRASWAIKVSEMEETNLDGLTAYKFYATLDVPEISQAQARYLGFSAYSTGGTETSALIASISAKNTPSEEPTSIIGGAGRDRGGWRSGSIDLSVDRAGNQATPVYPNDKLTIGFVLFSERQDITDTDTLYLDAIGVGSEDSLVPYEYKNGTSMATPAATGAAMIFAAEEDGSLGASEAALIRAQRLAGSVRPVAAFADICTSGGALDLAYATPATYTPVLSSATVHTEGGMRELTINGSFFGAVEGTVTISDVAAPVKVGTWTDSSVTVSIPDGLSSGVHTVALTTADDGSGNTRTGQKAFLLTLPSSPDSQETLLFEKEYALPSYEEGFPSDSVKATLVGLGGHIYLIPTGADGLSLTMWRLDPQKGTWSKCADLPEALSSISATSYKGMLAVVGGGEREEDVGVSLFFYDSQTDQWDFSRKGLSLPQASTIANWDETLLFFGGMGGLDEQGVPIEEDAIFTYDPDTDASGQVGTMTTGRMSPSVAVQGNTIVVTAQMYGGSDKAADLISMPSVTSVDITQALPVFADGRESHYAVAPVAEGVVLSGASAKDGYSRSANGVDPVEDQDTYILDTSSIDQGATFKALDRRVSYSQLFKVSTTAYRGALYTFGTSYFEEGGYVLRATAIETLDQPGDLYTITYNNATAGEYNNPTTYTASDLPLNLNAARDRQDTKFAGWYFNAELMGDPVTTIAAGTTGNIMLWAKWEAVGPGPGPVDPDPSALAATGDSLLIKSIVVALLLAAVACSVVIGLSARRRKQ